MQINRIVCITMGAPHLNRKSLVWRISKSPFGKYKMYIKPDCTAKQGKYSDMFVFALFAVCICTRDDVMYHLQSQNGSTGICIWYTGARFVNLCANKCRVWAIQYDSNECDVQTHSQWLMMRVNNGRCTKRTFAEQHLLYAYWTHYYLQQMLIGSWQSRVTEVGCRIRIYDGIQFHTELKSINFCNVFCFSINVKVQ